MTAPNGHEVGGHFRTLTEGDRNCDHAFINETSNRRKCASCGRREIWVPDHERGDAPKDKD